MYSFYISLSVGAAVTILIGLIGNWVWGPILGVVALLISQVVISRKFLKLIQPAFAQAQKLAQNQQIDPALKILEELKPMAKWVPMLDGQICAQMGVLYYGKGDKENAESHLKIASNRVADAKLLLAGLLYKSDRLDEAIEVLEKAIKGSKKRVILYHFAAFIQAKKENTEAALEVLQRCMKVEATNSATQNNISRLQNRQRLDMKQFDMEWYSLQIERPPGQMTRQQAMAAGRKGFRQPKKRR